MDGVRPGFVSITSRSGIHWNVQSRGQICVLSLFVFIVASLSRQRLLFYLLFVSTSCIQMAYLFTMWQSDTFSATLDSTRADERHQKNFSQTRATEGLEGERRLISADSSNRNDKNGTAGRKILWSIGRLCICNGVTLHKGRHRNNKRTIQFRFIPGTFIPAMCLPPDDTVVWIRMDPAAAAGASLILLIWKRKRNLFSFSTQQGRASRDDHLEPESPTIRGPVANRLSG